MHNSISHGDCYGSQWYKLLGGVALREKSVYLLQGLAAIRKHSDILRILVIQDQPSSMPINASLRNNFQLLSLLSYRKAELNTFASMTCHRRAIDQKRAPLRAQ